MNSKEGDLRDQKATVGKKANRNMEWVYEGGGWLTVFTSSKDGNDLSREEFRYDLR